MMVYPSAVTTGIKSQGHRETFLVGNSEFGSLDENVKNRIDLQNVLNFINRSNVFLLICPKMSF